MIVSSLSNMELLKLPKTRFCAAAKYLLQQCLNAVIVCKKE